MSERIRGQEQTLQVIVEGQDQTGTFINVTNFKVTPRIDIIETDFVGQEETDLDEQYHGVDFDFEVQKEDAKTREFLMSIISRQKLRQRPPRVTLILHDEFRDSAETGSNLVVTHALMKPDSDGSSGRKNYAAVTFSGKGKTLDHQRD